MYVILNSTAFPSLYYFCLRIYLASPNVSPGGMNPGPANLTMPITFTCQATGEPLPNITWYFNNTELVFPHAKYEMNLTVVNSTTVSSSLTVHDVVSYDVGLYTCLASNSAGNANISGVLTMNGKHATQSYCSMHYTNMHTCTAHIYIEYIYFVFVFSVVIIFSTS